MNDKTIIETVYPKILLHVFASALEIDYLLATDKL